MTEIMTVRARVKDGFTQVKLVAAHVMENGQNTDESGKLIPANFIQEIVVQHGGKAVFTANLGTAISKNPFLVFAFTGGSSGNELVINWLENTGKKGTEKAVIK